MSTNKVVNSAITLLNQSSVHRAEAKAAEIIEEVRTTLASISAVDRQVSSLQEELKKVEQDTITFETVVGQTPGGTVNTDTIVNTIASMNKARQDEVSSKAARLGQAITSYQASRKALFEQVEKLRKHLAEIKPEVVDETTILG
jgi:uncharacterized coiled-coil DUF342 family protein